MTIREFQSLLSNEIIEIEDSNGKNYDKNDLKAIPTSFDSRTQ